MTIDLRCLSRFYFALVFLSRALHVLWNGVDGSHFIDIAFMRILVVKSELGENFVSY